MRPVADEEWISSPPGAVCQDLLIHTIRSYDVGPRIRYLAGEYQTQLALVAAVPPSEPRSRRLQSEAIPTWGVGRCEVGMPESVVALDREGRAPVTRL